MFRANSASDRVLQFQLGQISMARLLNESQGTEFETPTTDTMAYGDADETEYPFNYADIGYVYQNATAPQTAPLYQATAPPPAGSSANSTRPQTRPSDHNFNLPRLQTKTDLLAGLNILRPDKPVRPNGTRWLCDRCLKAGLPEDACWHFGDDYLLCTTHWYRSELCNLPTSDPIVAQLHTRLGLTPSTPTSTGVPTAALRTQQPRACYLCGAYGHLAAHCEWAAAVDAAAPEAVVAPLEAAAAALVVATVADEEAVVAAAAAALRRSPRASPSRPRPAPRARR
eukprot:tig00020848_g14526.t1